MGSENLALNEVPRQSSLSGSLGVEHPMRGQYQKIWEVHFGTVLKSLYLVHKTDIVYAIRTSEIQKAEVIISLDVFCCINCNKPFNFREN